MSTTRPQGASFKIKIKPTGLEPGQRYHGHLHDAACDEGAGGHYKDVSGEELDFHFEANGKGRANTQSDADWVASEDAKSIVIHHGAHHGPKVACADVT